VHCGKCPRSYHVPRKFNSGNRNTRSRSNARNVSYVLEVEVGTVFTCEIVGKIYMPSTQRAYLGVRARALYYEFIERSPKAKNLRLLYSNGLYFIFKISVLASQYFKVSVFKNLKKCWSKCHDRVICEPPNCIRSHKNALLLSRLRIAARLRVLHWLPNYCSQHLSWLQCSLPFSRSLIKYARLVNKFSLFFLLYFWALLHCTQCRR
jgi:hypothetical protein